MTPRQPIGECTGAEFTLREPSLSPIGHLGVMYDSYLHVTHVNALALIRVKLLKLIFEV
jgi:hypothetical protein